MNKPLDLPDVTLRWSNQRTEPSGLVITHKKTGMTTNISANSLNAWLLRQLRSELVSSKDVK